MAKGTINSNGEKWRSSKNKSKLLWFFQKAEERYKDFFDTLKYHPDVEELVKVYFDTEDERKKILWIQSDVEEPLNDQSWNDVEDVEDVPEDSEAAPVEWSETETPAETDTTEAPIATELTEPENKKNDTNCWDIDWNGEKQENWISMPQEFLDWKNFRLHIWKMDKKDSTLYNEKTLAIWIEYMINHAKKWEHLVIEIRPDVWAILLKWDNMRRNENDKEEDVEQKDDILSAGEEQKKIQKFIKRKFWKKWDIIDVKIWSKKYPDVFEALEKWVWIIPDDWKSPIIPDKEPDLNEIDHFESPLQIIQFLAYNAKKDSDLMKLFYNTKPESLRKKDESNPWDSYFDYYWIVEVWLRLYEVLNWISIQWWMWRQRVYDKIISLIINWKDKIWWDEELMKLDKSFLKRFESDYTLNNIDDYPKLKELHEFCVKNYKDTKFNQLYIEIPCSDRGGPTKRVLSKLDKQKEIKSKLKKLPYFAAIASAIAVPSYELGKFRTEKRLEKEDEMFDVHYKNAGDEYLRRLDEHNKMENRHVRISEEQKYLRAAYDIWSLDYWNEYWLIKNTILDIYRLECLARKNESFLYANNFINIYWRDLIYKNYKIPYQTPYGHLLKLDAVNNTIKYKNISDPKIYHNRKKDTDYFYYDQKSRIMYKLKFVTIYTGDKDNPTAQVVYAANFREWYWNEVRDEDYTWENWVKCMCSMVEKYWDSNTYYRDWKSIN